MAPEHHQPLDSNFVPPSPAGSQAGWRRVQAWGLVLLLAGFLCLPLIVTVFNVVKGPDGSREEKRAPTPRLSPDIATLKQFPGVAKWYFSERYGLKDTLMFLHGMWTVKVLHTSASSAVLLGQGDWLYLASERVLDYHRGAEPLSETTLADWGQTLEHRRAWLAERGISYAFVVAPNTHTIYPEFLPTSLAGSTRTRLDQLMEGAARYAPKVKVIDLRPVLLEHKAQAPLYFKTDTHWNPIAGWLATREILGRLDLPISDGDLLPIRSRVIPGGDLARMLGLQRVYTETEDWPAARPGDLRLEDGTAMTTWDLTDVRMAGRVVVTSPTGHGTALVFRDSFGEALIPWLSGAFQKTIWVASYEFSEDLVLRDRPDVVIETLVERKLMQLIRPGGGLDE